MAYELFPDFRDISPESWAGADVKLVVDDLIKRTGIPEADLPSDLGLVELARLAKPGTMPEAERERLRNTDTGLLDRIETEQARQWREYELNHS